MLKGHESGQGLYVCKVSCLGLLAYARICVKWRLFLFILFTQRCCCFFFFAVHSTIFFLFFFSIHSTFVSLLFTFLLLLIFIQRLFLFAFFFFAPQISQEMESVGLGPNVVAYGAAMSALANGKKWEMALELLDEVGFIVVVADSADGCPVVTILYDMILVPVNDLVLLMRWVVVVVDIDSPVDILVELYSI